MPLIEEVGDALFDLAAKSRTEFDIAERFQGPAALDVLVVDDDPEMRMVALAALNSAGLCCTGVESARDAVELVRARRPRAVIVDLMLPDMSGLEFIRELRTDPGFGAAETSVVVLTGRSEEQDCAAAEVLGAARYFVKPVSPDFLTAEVRKLLAASQPASFRSPITGLPGAKALEQEVERRCAAGAAWSMLFVDVVELSGLNRCFGYKKGDEVIRTLGAVLSATREPDVRVFHASGAAFVEILPTGLLATEVDDVVKGFAMFQGRLCVAAGGVKLSPDPERACDPQPQELVSVSLRLAGLTIAAGRTDLDWPKLQQIGAEMMRELSGQPGKRIAMRRLD